MQFNRRPTRQFLRTVATTATVTTAMIGFAAACSKGDATSGASRAPAAGKITANAASDTDLAARGNGLPAGYSASFDHADARASDASYLQTEPGKWEVKTGPAHILYAARDTAIGKYSVSATFEQLEAPAHPEAFGVFVGGSNLDQPAKQKYTYFVVRGDGKYLVKVRDGEGTRTLTDWTTSPAVPRAVAGKALYGIRIDSDGQTAKVSVNGAPVTSIPAKSAPLNGISGVRINHNLHVLVTPVSVTR